jgi:crotonobetainyl-CoA:carnitine CoA-transferase CaiB-like acyl-CoA transferase
MSGPLSHLKVLDLSRVLAGPWATQFLGDLGADVIKIERPGQGDDTRAWGPPWFGDLSAYFTCANRNKRSMALDFTTPEGAATVRELAAEADVVIENFKRGALAKYGLDYASLKAVKRDLVYCSITGFGQTGPYADRAGYDALIQGMGGLMSITGEPDGQPMKVGVAVVDLFTGMYASSGILAALAHRDRTGEGQHIDLALFDVQAAMLANQAANYLATGRAPRRLGNAHPSICPYQTFAASDGYLILAVGNDQQFAKFCTVAGRPELAARPDFATNPARVANRETLIGILSEMFVAQPRAWWSERLEAVGVPCGPINTLDEVFTDPQLVARGMILGGPDGLRMVGNPLKFSQTPVAAPNPPPALGQHDGLGDSAVRPHLGWSALRPWPAAE